MSKIEFEKVRQSIWRDKTTGIHWLGANRVNGYTTALLNVDLLLSYFCNICDAAELLNELQRLIIDWCDLALTPDEIYNGRVGDEVYKDMQVPERFTRTLHECICTSSKKVALYNHFIKGAPCDDWILEQYENNEP